MIYYYLDIKDSNSVQKTEILEEIVHLLFEGSAKLISKTHLKELSLESDYLEKMKKSISSYDVKVPLYDINFNHIYLINSDNVYPYIYLENYRFVDQKFLDGLKNADKLSSADLENIRILDNYDMARLKKTYMDIFYKSFVITSHITDCRRPSFASGMDHISPYYSINELYFLAYDWNLTQKAVLSEKQIAAFCKEISKHDISAKTLLDHQIYIYDQKAIGLVKHYSLYGSYYMNLYLRKASLVDYTDAIVNEYLENQIRIMTNLVVNAPAFVDSHTVYRFIGRDDYMRNLQVGSIYQDASFMSTTRNPFYYKQIGENYTFGYILIKIKLPKDIKGIGLCIESYSNFPIEEEIILAPTSKYRLDALIETPEEIAFHDVFKLIVKKKYEFTWMGNDFIGDDKIPVSKNTKMNTPGAYIPPLKTVDFISLLKDENMGYLSISDRLRYFKDNQVNINNQFQTEIAGNMYLFNLEAYDSSSVYKKFFYYEVPDGIMLTTSNPKFGNINLIMEIGPEIHVNYYFKFSINDPSTVVDLNKPEWMEWFSLLAYVLGSRSVVIHSNYAMSYDKTDSFAIKQMKTRYTFSQNIYYYMKYKRKFYEFIEVIPAFEYYQFDQLFVIPVTDLIKVSDKNELFRIHKESKIDNLGDFYIYIIENVPKLIKSLEDKLAELYDPDKNPFNNISYKLDAWIYLLQRNLIQQIPSEKEFNTKKGSFKKLIGPNKITKFQNRLRTFLSSN